MTRRRRSSIAQATSNTSTGPSSASARNWPTGNTPQGDHTLMQSSALELNIRGVSNTYPNCVHALKDVSLTNAAGLYGLRGPNGAGKSTLMRILGTLQEGDTGTVMLGEIDVLKQKDEVRKTLGYLPQEFGVYPKVSG